MDEKDLFIIKPYTKQELRQFYELSAHDMRRWCKETPGLGKPSGRKYSSKQVEIFVAHWGRPVIHLD